MKQSWRLLAGSALTAAFMSGAVHALPIPDISTSPGTSFKTDTVEEALNGAGMAGMGVTACPVVGDCIDVLWAAQGETGGVAQGNGWSLSLTGDSFSSSWIFVGGTSAWSSLAINTRGGRATFDWIEDSDKGSPGSAKGWPFDLKSLDPDELDAINVEYSDILYVGGMSYGDLYTLMTINFVGGYTGNMEFRADTDRTGAVTLIPEPTTLALLSLGLMVLAVIRRKATARA